MTREQVRQIIGESATEEQINAILNAHSADIGRARQNDESNQNTINQLNEQLRTAQETITRLEGSNADAEAVRTELERYRTAEQQRIAAEQTAAAEAQMANRFNAAAGNAQFVNDFTRDGVLAQFKTAIANPANTGRADTEVLAELIKDKPGLMANPNPSVNIPGPAAINNQTLTVEAFKSMTLSDKMRWANANPDLYARMSELIKKG